MCCFSQQRGTPEFGTVILSFITAQAGAILPRPRFVLQRPPFNLDACFAVEPPLDLPERGCVVESGARS